MNAKTKKPDDFKVRLDFVKNSKNLDEIKDFISKTIKDSIINYPDLKKYKKISFIYDPRGSIDRFMLDNIYKHISIHKGGDTLLFLVSPGGKIDSAYMISKVLKEFSDKLVVVVPRMAKSAATLLSLGADEIHMGSISELGPIDPQINDLPALGLDNALEYIAEITSKNPGSSEMFAKYLNLSLGLKSLGFSKRVAESAQDYAIRLLGDKKVAEGYDAKKVAKRLVYEYKDHGFVIDASEAKMFLGDIIKTGTKEFDFGNEIYKFLEDLQILTNVFKSKYLSINGGVEDGIRLSDMPS